MVKIKDGHIFCCGRDLGKFKRGMAYFCKNCSSLILSRYEPQRTLDQFIMEKKKEVK